MSDFDSGDDLFDGVNADVLASTQYSSSAAKRKREPESSQDVDLLKKQRNVSDVVNLADASVLMHVAQNLLTETFGYKAFRHEQAGAIQRLLAGENALTVFPTGAGKSLCYQIPAFSFEQLDIKSGSKAPGEHGISIVVSPLIALMKDQVDALQRRNLPAECLDSTKTWEQVQNIYTGLREGRLRLLYCAPERLNNEGFVENMRNVRGGVRLLAVDEAHCVSEWGHSFRPEYLKVSRFANEIKAERVVCLTATATPKVIEDICDAFQIQPEGVFRTTLYRPNLNLHVKAAKTKEDKFPLLFDFLNKNPGPTLVYVTLQQQAQMMAADLRKHGYDAEAFHAGLSVELKTQIQDKFLANKVRIIVATIAFGMGIDKPDIRSIIHFDLSSTVEEYCQQIGRAGRDGKTSNCMYYVCPDDWYLRENFARGDLPSLRSLKAFLSDIFNQENVAKPVGDNFKTSHYVQSREFDIRTGTLGTIYAALELQFGLIRAITPEYSEYKFVPTNVYFARLSKENSPSSKAIYARAVKKLKFYHVDVNSIVSQTGIRRADIVSKLTDLNNAGVIELKAGGLEQRHRIMQPLPSSAAEIDVLAGRLHVDLSRREEDSLQRTKKVEDLITGDKCLALALAQHFGMGLPDGKSKCGHCTHCLTGRRTAMPPRPKKLTDMAGIKRILAACDVRDDPRFLARIAFGIKSPRVTKLKMDKHKVFMSLADHDFKADGLADIDHVVLFMQENRAFDHYFGTMPGVRGFADANLQMNGDKPVWNQVVDAKMTTKANHINPWYLNYLGGEWNDITQCMYAGSNGWFENHAAWNHGTNDHWAMNNTVYSIGYFQQKDIPIQWALADGWVIGDMYQEGVIASTSPNRVTWVSGSINSPGGPQKPDQGGNPYIDNHETPGCEAGGINCYPLKWKTTGEMFEKANVSWTVFQDTEDNFDDNPYAWFGQFQDAPKSSPLYEKGMVGSSMDSFYERAANGTLPELSYIIGPMMLSEHTPYTPKDGGWLQRKIADAVIKSPKYNKTALIYSYDETGGWADHVDPFRSPKGTAGEWLEDPYGKVGYTFTGPGYRVPFYIISPWTRNGGVYTEHTDHNSQILFLEKWQEAKGRDVKTDEMVHWRRENMGDLVNAFDFEKPNYEVVELPDTPEPHKNSKGKWDGASYCRAMHKEHQPPAPYTGPGAIQDMATVVGNGFKPVRGKLTEGRYLTFESNGQALTATRCGGNEKPILQEATAKHEKKAQRWVVHVVELGGSDFTISNVACDEYICTDGVLCDSKDKAAVFTVDYAAGKGYSLLEKETGEYWGVGKGSGSPSSSKEPAYWQLFSVKY